MLPSDDNYNQVTNGGRLATLVIAVASIIALGILSAGFIGIASLCKWATEQLP